MSPTGRPNNQGDNKDNKDKKDEKKVDSKDEKALDKKSREEHGQDTFAFLADKLGPSLTKQTLLPLLEIEQQHYLSPNKPVKLNIDEILAEILNRFNTEAKNYEEKKKERKEREKKENKIDFSEFDHEKPFSDLISFCCTYPGYENILALCLNVLLKENNAYRIMGIYKNKFGVELPAHYPISSYLHPHYIASVRHLCIASTALLLSRVPHLNQEINLNILELTYSETNPNREQSDIRRAMAKLLIDNGAKMLLQGDGSSAFNIFAKHLLEKDQDMLAFLFDHLAPVQKNTLVKTVFNNSQILSTVTNPDLFSQLLKRNISILATAFNDAQSTGRPDSYIPQETQLIIPLLIHIIAILPDNDETLKDIFLPHMRDLRRSYQLHETPKPDIQEQFLTLYYKALEFGKFKFADAIVSFDNNDKKKLNLQLTFPDIISKEERALLSKSQPKILTTTSSAPRSGSKDVKDIKLEVKRQESKSASEEINKDINGLITEALRFLENNDKTSNFSFFGESTLSKLRKFINSKHVLNENNLKTLVSILNSIELKPFLKDKKFPAEITVDHLKTLPLKLQAEAALKLMLESLSKQNSQQSHIRTTGITDTREINMSTGRSNNQGDNKDNKDNKDKKDEKKVDSKDEKALDKKSQGQSTYEILQAVLPVTGVANLTLQYVDLIQRWDILPNDKRDKTQLKIEISALLEDEAKNLEIRKNERAERENKENKKEFDKLQYDQPFSDLISFCCQNPGYQGLLSLCLNVLSEGDNVYKLFPEKLLNRAGKPASKDSHLAEYLTPHFALSVIHLCVDSTKSLLNSTPDLEPITIMSLGLLGSSYSDNVDTDRDTRMQMARLLIEKEARLMPWVFTLPRETKVKVHGVECAKYLLKKDPEMLALLMDRMQDIDRSRFINYVFGQPDNSHFIYDFTDITNSALFSAILKYKLESIETNMKRKMQINHSSELPSSPAFIINLLNHAAKILPEDDNILKTLYTPYIKALCYGFHYYSAYQINIEDMLLTFYYKTLESGKLKFADVIAQSIVTELEYRSIYLENFHFPTLLSNQNKLLLTSNQTNSTTATSSASSIETKEVKDVKSEAKRQEIKPPSEWEEVNWYVNALIRDAAQFLENKPKSFFGNSTLTKLNQFILKYAIYMKPDLKDTWCYMDEKEISENQKWYAAQKDTDKNRYQQHIVLTEKNLQELVNIFNSTDELKLFFNRRGFSNRITVAHLTTLPLKLQAEAALKSMLDSLSKQNSQQSHIRTTGITDTREINMSTGRPNNQGDNKDNKDNKDKKDEKKVDSKDEKALDAKSREALAKMSTYEFLTHMLPRALTEQTVLPYFEPQQQLYISIEHLNKKSIGEIKAEILDRFNTEAKNYEDKKKERKEREKNENKVDNSEFDHEKPFSELISFCCIYPGYQNILALCLDLVLEGENIFKLRGEIPEDKGIFTTHYYVKNAQHYFAEPFFISSVLHLRFDSVAALLARELDNNLDSLWGYGLDILDFTYTDTSPTANVARRTMAQLMINHGSKVVGECILRLNGQRLQLTALQFALNLLQKDQDLLLLLINQKSFGRDENRIIDYIFRGFCEHRDDKIVFTDITHPELFLNLLNLYLPILAKKYSKENKELSELERHQERHYESREYKSSNYIYPHPERMIMLLDHMTNIIPENNDTLLCYKNYMTFAFNAFNHYRKNQDKPLYKIQEQLLILYYKAMELGKFEFANLIVSFEKQFQLTFPKMTEKVEASTTHQTITTSSTSSETKDVKETKTEVKKQEEKALSEGEEMNSRLLEFINKAIQATPSSGLLSVFSTSTKLKEFVKKNFIYENKKPDDHWYKNEEADDLYYGDIDFNHKKYEALLDKKGYEKYFVPSKGSIQKLVNILNGASESNLKNFLKSQGFEPGKITVAHLTTLPQKLKTEMALTSMTRTLTKQSSQSTTVRAENKRP